MSKGLVEVPRKGVLPAFIVSTGLFIRDHLLDVGEDYSQAIYRKLKKEKTKRGVKVGSYSSFRQYMWWLAQLKLIEFARSESSQNPILQDRRYYRIVPGAEDSPAWQNPRRYLYPKSWEKHH